MTIYISCMKCIYAMFWTTERNHKETLMAIGMLSEVQSHKQDSEKVGK